MRKVYVNVTVRLLIETDDGVDIADVIDNMSCDFTSEMEEADISDLGIQDWDIEDSK